MPFRQLRFLRRWGVSAGTENASHAANAGEPLQGAKDHSRSRAAEHRSGARTRRTIAQAVATRRASPLKPGASALYAALLPSCRLASNKNQVRRSVSSIK